MSRVSSSIVKGCFAAVLTLIFAPSLAQAQLFTLSSITGWWDYDDSGTIRQVNPATGATISIQGIRLPPGSMGSTLPAWRHIPRRESFLCWWKVLRV